MQHIIFGYYLRGFFMSDQVNFYSDGFYTLKGYSLIDGDSMTSAMEDYLEMIFRLYKNNEVIRIKNLSEILHVKPSSASKMANILKNENLIHFEKYGQITLTEKGEILGEYLLCRHNILNRFFCIINHSEDELSLVEKIEHFIDNDTILHIKEWLNEMEH